MQNKEKSLNNINSSKPPRGLFAQIIRRLGLEKQLRLVKKYLVFFATFFVIFLTLSVFAFIGFRHVLAQSSFGPFLSLIFSDPKMVLKYWQIFLTSVFESMPGVHILFFLISLAMFLLFIKLASSSLEKFHLVVKSIKKSRFASRQSRD